MLMKMCPKCGKAIQLSEKYCENCRPVLKQNNSERNKEYDAYKRDKQADKFYHSKKWKNIRDYVLMREGGFCQDCLKNNRRTIATDVHHIIPVKQDWSKRLDIDNLVSLCEKCHKRREVR